MLGEIAFHHVFQSGSGGAEAQGIQFIGQIQATINVSRDERVSSSNAVDDWVDVVSFGFAIPRFMGKTDPGQAVVAGTQGIPAGGNDALSIRKTREHLFRHVLKVRGFHAKNIFGVAFGANHHVTVFNQGGHYFLYGFAILPEVAAVVHIGADGDSQAAGGFQCLQTGHRSIVRYSRRDARPVKPASVSQKFIPVKSCRIHVGKSAVVTVVNDARRAHTSAHLQKVQTQSLTLVYCAVKIYPMLAVEGGGCTPEVVVGKTGDVTSRYAQLGQCYGYVGFATTISNFQITGLQKTLMAGGVQAHHDLSEGDDFFHRRFWGLRVLGF